MTEQRISDTMLERFIGINCIGGLQAKAGYDALLDLRDARAENERLRSQAAALHEALEKLHDEVAARPEQPVGTHGVPHSWWTRITRANLAAQHVLADAAPIQPRSPDGSAVCGWPVVRP